MSSVKDVQALIQDLQVHQIELEMQHEEPQKGRLHDIETMVDFFWNLVWLQLFLRFF
jgi:L-amino acid N-acyltransferase YncA